MQKRKGRKMRQFAMKVKETNKEKGNREEQIKEKRGNEKKRLKDNGRKEKKRKKS